jgi:hypothetical protein
MNRVSLRCSSIAVALVIGISFGIVMMAMAPSRSFAQQEDPNSMIGTYTQGYDKGKLNAVNTFNAGGHYNGTCPPAHSTAYCVWVCSGI